MAVTAKANPEQNKRVAREFLELQMNQGKPEEAADRYMGPHYTQHDAQAKDGREGFIEISRWALDKYPQVHQDIRRIVADGELVMVHSLLTFSPEDRGTAAVDILRFEDGKIVEHWDVQQAVPESTQSGNSFI